MNCCVEIHDCDELMSFSESCGDEQATLCKLTHVSGNELPSPWPLCQFHKMILEEMGFIIQPLPDARQMEMVN